MSDTMTEREVLDLPRFRAALQKHAEGFKVRKYDATYWRYHAGILPANVKRLMEHPELLEALAADAREIDSDVLRRNPRKRRVPSP